MCSLSHSIRCLSERRSLKFLSEENLLSSMLGSNDVFKFDLKISNKTGVHSKCKGLQMGFVKKITFLEYAMNGKKRKKAVGL